MTTTDVTHLSDAAFDALLSIRAGEEVVDVAHLSASERADICNALGISAPVYWLTGNRESTGSKNARRAVGFDFELAILDEQAEDA